MTTDIDHGALRPQRPSGAGTPGSAARTGWTLLTAALVAALFAQAAFAGAMLSGAAWARAAHMMGAAVLIAASVLAGVIALLALRRTSNGPRLGLTLLGLGVGLLLQTILGRLSAHGASLLWAHVPLGVALVGLAGQALATARKLGG